MLMTERQKEKRRSTFGREMTDIGVGIAIVILSVLVFLNPDANRAVFPVIFLLGAGLLPFQCPQQNRQTGSRRGMACSGNPAFYRVRSSLSDGSDECGIHPLGVDSNEDRDSQIFKKRQTAIFPDRSCARGFRYPGQQSGR